MRNVSGGEHPTLSQNLALPIYELIPGARFSHVPEAFPSFPFVSLRFFVFFSLFFFSLVSMMVPLANWNLYT